MAVRMILNDAHFQTELQQAGPKLVVVDFTASWCGPCQRISPFFDLLPSKYPKAIFLKVDVDKCASTASGQGVSAMPTFIFYRNKCKIDRIQGADITEVENKIQQYITTSTAEESSEDYGQGMLDLNTFISKQECECLNEADNHNLAHALVSTGGFLQSDCDEQLIISVTFNQLVKIHSLKIKAPPALGPKEIKLFINQPTTIDFDKAEGMKAVQELTVDAKDLEAGNPINLRFVKFQNVQNIQMFVRNNQSGGEVTQIDYLSFIGMPIMTTKMQSTSCFRTQRD
jgi:thiol-disulfide isomerase/thioredoxin